MDESETYSIHNLVSKVFGFVSLKVFIYRFVLLRKCEADFHGVHKWFWEVTRENIHKKNKKIIIEQCIGNQCKSNNSTSYRVVKLVDTIIHEFYNFVD